MPKSMERNAGTATGFTNTVGNLGNILQPNIGRRARRLDLGSLSSVTIAALSLRRNAFPQSGKLGPQPFAAELALETDHLVTRRTGAKPRGWRM